MRKLVMSSLQDEQINDDEQGKSFSANCCQNYCVFLPWEATATCQILCEPGKDIFFINVA